MGALQSRVDGGQSELWEELTVKNQWFHVMRTDILDNKIAEMGTTAWAVYCVIKSYTNMKSGDSFPSQATIAGHLGVSVDTVARATEKLIEMGKVTREKTGRKSLYRTVETVPLERKSDSQRVGQAQHDYVPMGFHSFVKELENYAQSGKLPPNATFKITFNVTNIQQGDNSTVNISNVTLSDEETIRTDAVLSAVEGATRQLTSRARALKKLDWS